MMSKMYTILLICYTFMTAFVTEKSLTMQQAPDCFLNSVRFRDVAGGRGVDGRRAADDVRSSPTAAATGGVPPGMPLSERGLLVATWWCGGNSMSCV